MQDSQFVKLPMADGIHHVSKDFLYFKQLQACNGKEYTDASELIDDYSKYLRLMRHFNTFEQEENQDIKSKYPSYPLLARCIYDAASPEELQFEGKTIPYRVLKVSKDPKGKQCFTLANHRNLYWASELEFYIKTSLGLIKLS